MTPSKRALTRPRPAISNTNTVSTPNLASAYSASTTSAASQHRSNFLVRKSSLNALTPGSLATIPDASHAYGLSTVLDDEDSILASSDMSQRAGGAGSGEIEVGDWVDVPGSMHGTVRFVGNVDGKKGIFAGVELSEEFASKGKNNGDVDGYAMDV